MRELTIFKNITAGVTTTIYTVPKGCKAIATLLFLANSGGTTKTISAAVHDASTAATVPIVGAKSLGAGDALQFNQGRMVMDEFDYITVTSESGATMSCIFTMEILQTTSYQHVS
jgi:hypothetical protein